MSVNECSQLCGGIDNAISTTTLVTGNSTEKAIKDIHGCYCILLKNRYGSMNP